MDNKEKKKKQQNIKELMKGIAAYTSASILGPLLILGGLGYIADRYFQTYPVMLLISLAVAFIVTNILLFKKVKVLMKKTDEMAEKESEKDSK